MVANVASADLQTLENGTPAALRDLAEQFEHGEGVRRNYSQAHALYCLAAMQGDGESLYNLGWMYGIELAKRIVLGSDPNATLVVVSDLLAYGGILAYGREAEYQADEASVQITAKTGYNPKGMASFLEKLRGLEDHEPGALEILLRTHPPTSGRIENVNREIRKLGNPGGGYYEERFKKAVAQLR